MKLSEKVRHSLKAPLWRTFLRAGSQQLLISFGAVLVAFAYVLFQLPYNLAAGGISGLGVIVHHLTGFPPGVFFFLANIPLFMIGFFKLGRWHFLFSSAIAVVVFSIATEFFINSMPAVLGRFPITEDKLLASIFTGLLVGIGSGIIYRYGGTIGGTSIPARIIYKKTGFSMSQSALYSEVGVIFISGLVFNWETALLAFLALLLSGMAADFALEGASKMRTLTIVTNYPEPIRYAIVNELRQGVSMWKVEGGYSGNEHTLLYCTVLRSKIYDVKYIINRLDPDAFLVVGVSQQTWGGYNSPKNKPASSETQQV